MLIVDGPISAEAISLDADGMIKEARELSKIHKNIVVKIPHDTRRPEGSKNSFKRRDKDKCNTCLLALSGAHLLQRQGQHM